MKTLQHSATRYPTGFPAVVASQQSVVPDTPKKVRGIWDDQTVEKIKTLVGNKLSAEAIGERLGLTRSQVLGICWRRGIQLGDQRPSHSHVPKARSIGKRLLERGQAVREVVLALPDTREARSPDAPRIIRKPAVRKTKQEAAPHLPGLFDLPATPDTTLNSAGAAFIRQYKKRAQKAKASPETAAEPVVVAVEVPVLETLSAPIAEIILPSIEAPAPAVVIVEESAPVVTEEVVAVTEQATERDLSKCPMIFELRENHCRYPVEGTGVSMIYCGEPAMTGKPYCAHCAKITYEKPEKLDAKPARRKMSAFAMRSGINFR
ncbi:hypothetical protein IC232_03415 [Microvirga sp. BT688]|uniref:GcrA family cell cycle regulator n=1 Tax=Microvirga sp. TaxID=1873136 RepID=UPI0016822199|nr:GcrA family cell cycle regulator [Microvirga sp.]MBD2745738.1 hypothetical protein [Microvirga sp.]